MKEAGHTAVEVEPQLQSLDGETFEYKSANKDDEARSDIKCCGFWGNRLRQAYFDVKVVSPFARSNSHLEPAQLFKNAERMKIREYKDVSQTSSEQTSTHWYSPVLEEWHLKVT